MKRPIGVGGASALRALLKATAGDPDREWQRLLKDHVYLDGFAALLGAPGLASVFGRTGTPSSFDAWLLNLPEWKERALSISPEPDPLLVAMFELWGAFESDLSSQLRRAKAAGALPRRGGVLAFVGGMSKCVVIRFDIFGDAPRLEVVAVIDKPRSAFDFWGALDDVDAKARNYLKNILATGHKIVYHRGTLIHVDRRADAGVFGPSIDTVLLAEILARDVFESRDSRVHAVLEIGCGSGMLAAAVMRHTSALERLSAIDVDFPAVSCTWRNCSMVQPLRDPPIDFHLVCGPFRPALVGGGFDLVVCNPPYIPDPTAEACGRSSADFYRAIGGTDLIGELLDACPRLLSKSGRLLMMLSSVCLKQARGQLPDGWRMQFPLGRRGFEVLFDVEAVLENRQWTEYLLQKHGLQERDGAYYHVLHPVWISRRSIAGG
jgi:methylase of polypeptide subunit release factors